MSTVRIPAQETDIARKGYEIKHRYAEFKKTDWPKEKAKVERAHHEYIQEWCTTPRADLEHVSNAKWKTALENAENYSDWLERQNDTSVLDALHITHNGLSDRNKFIINNKELILKSDWIGVKNPVDLIAGDYKDIAEDKSVSAALKKFRLEVWKNKLDNLRGFFEKRFASAKDAYLAENKVTADLLASSTNEDAIDKYLSALREILFIKDPLLKEFSDELDKYEEKFQLAKTDFDSTKTLGSGFSLCCCWNNSEKENHAAASAPGYQLMK